jgi:UPF0755 protein
MPLRPRKHTVTVFSLLALVISIAVYHLVQMQQVMYRAIALDEVVSVELNRGDSLRSLARRLAAQGITDQPEYFIWWARIRGAAHHLQAGEYQLQPGQTLAELLDAMITGNVRQYSITLVDGWNIRQLMQAIASHPHITHSITPMNTQTLMRAIGRPHEHPEGRFFPDTYYLHKAEQDRDILQRAYLAMEITLQQLWATRDAHLPLATPYEALILASIVEKESAVADERPLIAGVFINRLRKNMRLQTDPTVIYGIGEAYDGDIRYRDLRTDSPYNTYTRSGLPPTPIAMPGRAAIEAVLHPEPTDYLYFVANSDGSGRHLFSSTLDAHENYVDQHQRRRNK